MAYLILSLGWVLFYGSHSFLSALNIKRKFRAIMGNGYIWYRLLYSLWSAILFLGIFLYAATIPPNWLWQQGYMGTYFGFMLATFGTVLAVKSFKGTRLPRFIGIQPYDDLQEQDELLTMGLYRYMRHPLYAGLILIFLGYFLYIPNLASMIHLLALLAYLPLGIHFEEKKLLQLYGEKYSMYRQRVPPLIPKFDAWKN